MRVIPRKEKEQIALRERIDAMVQHSEEQIQAFSKVKAAFWSYVDEVAVKLDKTRADFPTGAYSADLLAWCQENGLDYAETADLAIKFCGIASDLGRIGYNWNDLFTNEQPQVAK